MSNQNKKLPKFLSWEKQGDLYVVEVQYDNGQVLTAYKNEANFKFELFKRKLQDEYNVPYEVIQDLEDVVVDVSNQAVEESQID